MKLSLHFRFAAAAFALLATVHYSSGQNILTNGGFETGSLAGWTVASASSSPFVSSTGSHTGVFDAFLGSPSSGSETAGNSAIFQLTPILPANAVLSFFWSGFTNDGNINFDWQDAYVLNSSGALLATLVHTCTNTGGYVPVTFSLASFAGQQVRIEFLVHGNGNIFPTPTNMRIDDVVVTPEPSTFAMMGAGALLLLAAMRFRRSHRKS